MHWICHTVQLSALLSNLTKYGVPTSLGLSCKIDLKSDWLCEISLKSAHYKDL